MLTITDACLIGAILLVFIEVILIIKKVPLFRNLLIAAFFVYLVLVCGVTLFPIPYQEGAGFDVPYNFVPFASIGGALKDGVGQAIRNIGGNLLLLLPLGMLLPLLSRKLPFWKCLLLLIAASIGIELAQHLIGLAIGYRYRSVDVDDVLLNLLGGALGYGGCKLLPRSLTTLLD